MRIAIDVMGGDFAPDSIIEGAVDSLQCLSPDDEMVLIGDKEIIYRKLEELNTSPSNF